MSVFVYMWCTTHPLRSTVLSCESSHCTSNTFCPFQMNGITPSRFYSQPKPALCASNNSFVLVVDSIKEQVFKSLKFPIREKARKILRFKIAIQDRRFFTDTSLDELMSLTTIRKDWSERIVSERGDKNVVDASSVKVRKIRSETVFEKNKDGIAKYRQEFGYEVVVTITRKRLVGCE